MGYLDDEKRYQSLSIRDILDARDAYHVFLMRKKNVIGTAIGKYRPRKTGVDKKEPKTLENTELRSYSWPCVMVFVENWIAEEKFGKRGASNDDYLPQRLYLADGREIPVCVIKAAWRQKSREAILRMKFPGNTIGGGYPVLTRVQGQERWASLGCLVSDGRRTYGLTNAHVAGHPGESLFTMSYGNVQEIGVSAQKQLQKMSFTDVYEGLPGKHTLANLDIGLIEFNDLNEVTAQVFGLGELKGIADVNHDTLSLKLIGCPVMGYGCASGMMKGEIAGLFYRYDTAGGYDYVTDYLIGPRNVKQGSEPIPFNPMHGDSGTLLVIDDPPDKRHDDSRNNDHMKAIALLWGGQQEVNGAREQPYGLATNLGTICRLLDVELVSDWNTGYDTYFGAYAHITLPSLCVSAVEDNKLKDLMEHNKSRFSKPLEGTAIKDTKGLSDDWFVPLSDVPDLVWKRRGGEFQRGKEGANHFADMDQPNPKDNGRTLLDLCIDPAKIDPDVWVKFYADIDARDKGALPFRIAQIYHAMVSALKLGNTAEYVCAAGILTHYVFDACMPLHISYMHHGDPDGLKKISSDTGKEVPLAYEVHDEFDNQLVEYYKDEITVKLPQLVQEEAASGTTVKAGQIKSTIDAALAAVTLMGDTVQKHASPRAIVKDFEERVIWKKRDRCDWLWQKYGGGLQKAMAEAAVLTARLWEAAWINGNGEQMVQSTDAVSESILRQCYETRDGFLVSVSLEDIKATMSWDNA